MKRFLSRRQILQDSAVGFGAMALNSMLQREGFAAESALAKERFYDLKPKPPHFAPKAKNVLFIYVGGGPSTIDMFDPKPALMKYDGKPAPFEIKGRALNGSQQIMASPWKFKDCGEHGRQVSATGVELTAVSAACQKKPQNLETELCVTVLLSCDRHEDIAPSGQASDLAPGPSDLRRKALAHTTIEPCFAYQFADVLI